MEYLTSHGLDFAAIVTESGVGDTALERRAHTKVQLNECPGHLDSRYQRDLVHRLDVRGPSSSCAIISSPISQISAFYNVIPWYLGVAANLDCTLKGGVSRCIACASLEGQLVILSINTCSIFHASPTSPRPSQKLRSNIFEISDIMLLPIWPSAFSTGTTDRKAVVPNLRKS